MFATKVKNNYQQANTAINQKMEQAGVHSASLKKDLQKLKADNIGRLEEQKNTFKKLKSNTSTEQRANINNKYIEGRKRLLEDNRQKELEFQKKIDGSRDFIEKNKKRKTEINNLNNGSRNTMSAGTQRALGFTKTDGANYNKIVKNNLDKKMFANKSSLGGVRGLIGGGVGMVAGGLTQPLFGSKQQSSSQTQGNYDPKF